MAELWLQVSKQEEGMPEMDHSTIELLERERERCQEEQEPTRRPWQSKHLAVGVLFLALSLSLCVFSMIKASARSTKALPHHRAIGEMINDDTINNYYYGDTLQGDSTKIDADHSTVGVGVKQLKTCEGSGNDGHGAGAVGVVCCSGNEGAVHCDHASSGGATQESRLATNEELEELQKTCIVCDVSIFAIPATAKALYTLFFQRGTRCSRLFERPLEDFSKGFCFWTTKGFQGKRGFSMKGSFKRQGSTWSPTRRFWHWAPMERSTSTRM